VRALERSLGVIAGVAASWLGSPDTGAVAGKGNFLKFSAAHGRALLTEGLDGEFVAACGLDDEFGDALGIAIGADRFRSRQGRRSRD
jgi:hypothetical protein